MGLYCNFTFRWHQKYGSMLRKKDAIQKMSFSHCFCEPNSFCQLYEALGNIKLKNLLDGLKNLNDLFSISSLESRHLLYLQLRKSILESHILCNDEELISLGGLALQSEIGDFTEPVSGKFIKSSVQ